MSFARSKFFTLHYFIRAAGIAHRGRFVRSSSRFTNIDVQCNSISVLRLAGSYEPEIQFASILARIVVFQRPRDMSKEVAISSIIPSKSSGDSRRET